MFSLRGRGEGSLLQMSILFFAVPYFYSYYYQRSRVDDDGSTSVENSVTAAYDNIIYSPSMQFNRIVVGINCNVDLIVSGTSLLNRMNVTASPDGGRDYGRGINSTRQLEATFAHFFQRGAPAERYTAEGKAFDQLLSVAERELANEIEYAIGGNAALMAQNIVRNQHRSTTILVGPIGPRAKALLHPHVIIKNSTRIGKDEMHIIMEYKQGEIWGDYVAPTSSRFITSHDVFSSSAVVIDMFFKTIQDNKPDLVCLSGIHLLEFQPEPMWQEKLRLIKRGLGLINPSLPIHLELGSMADQTFAKHVLNRIIPYVDSLGLNEQEMAFLSLVAEGPYSDQYPVRAGTMVVHKAVEMLIWLINTYGQDKTEAGSKKAGYRLQRIHFQCLTYHIIVTKGTDWSNQASALAAGARLAGRQTCGLKTGQLDTGLLDIRTGKSFLIDKQQGRVYNFNPHNPLTSWMRQDVLLIFTPVLVCKHPIKTVGVGDAIAAVSLVYSQFYRFQTAAGMVPAAGATRYTTMKE